MKYLKIAAFALATLALVLLIAITLRYKEPLDIERACKEASPPLINNINSCELINQVLRSFEVEGYEPVTLENSKTESGLFRQKLQLQTIEVTHYKINGDASTGTAHFSFLNGRLYSIAYYPDATDAVFKNHPAKNLGVVTVKHLKNHQERRYILWSNNQFETYITWWISRFS